MPTSLCPAEILAITGEDAESFLQAQLCSDVTTLAAGHWQWSAWLDAQGRVRHFFALLRPEPECWLAWLPLGGAEIMRTTLVRFILRARVELQELPDWTLQRVAPIESLDLSHGRLRAQRDGWLLLQPAGPSLLAPAAERGFNPQALQTWRLAAVRAGLPLLAAELAGKFVAPALGLERFGAIEHRKGCYPGQEIVARLRFRGGGKRHLERLALPGAPPSPGTPLLAPDARAGGRILYAAAAGPDHAECLAVIGPTPAAGLTTAEGVAAQSLARFETSPDSMENAFLPSEQAISAG